MSTPSALRPWRLDVKRDQIVHYEGVRPKDGDGPTFVRGWLNRLRSCGMLADDGKGWRIDVLDQDGDLIEEHYLTRDGYKWLRGRWHMRIDRP